MKKIILAGAAGLAACCGAAALLLYNGVILFHNPPAEEYPVRGVDVSSYQGEIDWEALAGQDIAFAFIKATEGSGFVDGYFEANYANARAAGLRVGAYHFFSYDSGGAAQAENFIATVPKMPGMLPPVIDVEFYGDKEKNPPDRASVDRELAAMATALEEAYGMSPVIYATEKSYRMFIAGGYGGCDIWIRDVVFAPELSDGRAWTFWQYTNREVLEGYAGEEKFIDMNVFRGSREEFAGYGGRVSDE